MDWIYPYGDSYSNIMCWTQLASDEPANPSGDRSRCTNAYGVFDMSGNVLEWVNDYYSADYYSSSVYENPTGPPVGSSRVFRGGASFHGGLATRCSFRVAYDPEMPKFGAGVRCCSD